MKDESIRNLFMAPDDYKLEFIEPILATFPQRKFVLVGDSGEKDPEVYGTLGRRHPDQIIGIYIRNVTNEDSGAERYLTAFKSVPKERWTVFTVPLELSGSFFELNRIANRRSWLYIRAYKAGEAMPNNLLPSFERLDEDDA